MFARLSMLYPACVIAQAPTDTERRTISAAAPAQLQSKYAASSLAAFLATRPRVALGTLPTPLEACPRLSAAAGIAERTPLYAKRDDLTGFALGGNKVRMLEYLLGEAIAEGADCLMTGADAQSNQCRAVAAAAAKLGLGCTLVVNAGLHPEMQGNLLLQHLYGADVRMVQVGDLLEVQRVLDGVEQELRAQGRRPYRITGQYVELALKAMVGYMGGALELAAQMDGLPEQPASVVLCAGSGTTYAGFACGLKALGITTRVTGISIITPAAQVAERVLALSRLAAETYGLDCALSPDEIDIRDGHIGPGYGHVSEEGLAATTLAARTEGMLLDPVYTSKTMAGLLALARGGALSAGPSVFVHTGGIPGVFAYHRELAAGIGAA